MKERDENAIPSRIDAIITIRYNTNKQNENDLKNERKEKGKEKHTVGLEPTISCSVGKRLIQLGYACLLFPKIDIL